MTNKASLLRKIQYHAQLFWNSIWTGALYFFGLVYRPHIMIIDKFEISHLFEHRMSNATQLAFLYTVLILTIPLAIISSVIGGLFGIARGLVNMFTRNPIYNTNEHTRSQLNKLASTIPIRKFVNSVLSKYDATKSFTASDASRKLAYAMSNPPISDSEDWNIFQDIDTYLLGNQRESISSKLFIAFDSAADIYNRNNPDVWKYFANKRLNAFNNGKKMYKILCETLDLISDTPDKKEIRKNAQILAQARRGGGSLFSMFQPDIAKKIAAYTGSVAISAEDALREANKQYHRHDYKRK